MPFQPTPSSLHVNALLTNVSVAYLQKPTAFAAPRAFLNVPVQKQSDRYIKYPKDAFNRDEMKLRGPSSESAGSGYEIDNTPSYSCDTYALHKDIPDQLRANADAPISLDRETTEFLTLKALIQQEKSFAAQFMTTSV
jgi:hypothetical protein